MKKITSILLSSAIIFSSSYTYSPSEAINVKKLKDGSWEVSTEGYNALARNKRDKLNKFKLTVTNGNISNIELLEFNDRGDDYKEILQNYILKMNPKIISGEVDVDDLAQRFKNRIDFISENDEEDEYSDKDVITGATYSVYSYMDAVKKAIKLSEDAAKLDPNVTKVKIVNTNQEFRKGNNYTFTSNAEGENLNSESNSVTWSLSGNSNPQTSINSNGLLSISSEETSKTLVVKAVSTYNNRVEDSFTVNIQEDAQEPPSTGDNMDNPSDSRLKNGSWWGEDKGYKKKRNIVEIKVENGNIREINELRYSDSKTGREKEYKDKFDVGFKVWKDRIIGGEDISRIISKFSKRIKHLSINKYKSNFSFGEYRSEDERDVISGATYSVNSFIKAVNDAKTKNEAHSFDDNKILYIVPVVRNDSIFVNEVIDLNALEIKLLRKDHKVDTKTLSELIDDGAKIKFSGNRSGSIDKNTVITADILDSNKKIGLSIEYLKDGKKLSAKEVYKASERTIIPTEKQVNYLDLEKVKVVFEDGVEKELSVSGSEIVLPSTGNTAIRRVVGVSGNKEFTLAQGNNYSYSSNTLRLIEGTVREETGTEINNLRVPNKEIIIRKEKAVNNLNLEKVRVVFIGGLSKEIPVTSNEIVLPADANTDIRSVYGKVGIKQFTLTNRTNYNYSGGVLSIVQGYVDEDTPSAINRLVLPNKNITIRKETPKSNDKYKNGTYDGVGNTNKYNDRVDVRINVSNGVVASIDNYVEGEDYESKYRRRHESTMSRITPKIIKLLNEQGKDAAKEYINSLDRGSVDVTSGATYTLRSTKDALLKAIDNLKLGSSNTSGGSSGGSSDTTVNPGQPSEHTIDNYHGYRNGTYTGRGRGFRNFYTKDNRRDIVREKTIGANITIRNGNVTLDSVQWNDKDNSEHKYSRKFEENKRRFISRILNGKKVDEVYRIVSRVIAETRFKEKDHKYYEIDDEAIDHAIDATSGATYSTFGLFEAVKEAIENSRTR